jgi:RIO kinase 1
VHADLSEYNTLYHNGHLWIIDVSQSVEHGHPSAFDFLRNDIKNIEGFFGRLGVKCLGLRRCFEFVTKEKVSDVEGESEEDALKSWLEFDQGEAGEAGTRADTGIIPAAENLTISESESESNQPPDRGAKGTEDAAHEDSVFLHSFIPRTLNEVYDPERDVEKLKRGDDLIYADTIGLVPIGAGPKNGDNSIKSHVSYEGLEDGDSNADDGGGEQMFVEKRSRGHKHEDRDSKKVTSARFFQSRRYSSFLKQERKKVVKAEQAERRKHKMPKAEKKRLVKKGG